MLTVKPRYNNGDGFDREAAMEELEKLLGKDTNTPRKEMQTKQSKVSSGQVIPGKYCGHIYLDQIIKDGKKKTRKIHCYCSATECINGRYYCAEHAKVVKQIKPDDKKSICKKLKKGKNW